MIQAVAARGGGARRDTQQKCWAVDKTLGSSLISAFRSPRASLRSAKLFASVPHCYGLGVLGWPDLQSSHEHLPGRRMYLWLSPTRSRKEVSSRMPYAIPDVTQASGRSSRPPVARPLWRQRRLSDEAQNNRPSILRKAFPNADGPRHSTSREGRCPANLLPSSKSTASELAVISRRKPVTSRAEMRSANSVDLDEALACPADLNRRMCLSRSRAG